MELYLDHGAEIDRTSAVCLLKMCTAGNILHACSKDGQR